MEGLAEVKQSYGRACLQPKFFDRFYDIFLQSSPRIKPMFANTDFKKQKEALRTGLAMLLAHVEGKAAGTMTVNRIAESHKKTKMNIEPNLYPFWIKSLVKAVKEHDQQWNADLEGKWEKCLKVGVDHIVAQYNN